MSDVFRAFGWDINSQTLIGEIPFYGITFGSRLGDAGAISFSVNLEDPNVQSQMQSFLQYNGEPWFCFIDRDGTLVSGNMVQTTNYQKSTGQMEFGGKDILAYWDQRVIAADYTSVQYPSGVDPAALLAQVYVDSQSITLCGPGASVGAQILGGTSALTPITPGYPRAGFTIISSIANDLIQLLQPGAGTLDITSTYAYNSSGVPVINIQIWSPRAGRVAGTTGLIFDMNSCLDYTWPTDVTSSGNTVIATGNGAGTSMPQATVQAPGVPVGGLGQAPRLDLVTSFPSATSQTQISIAANGAATQFGMPLITPTITIATSDVQNPLGSWIMGDDARLFNSGDPRFQTGLDQYWRIIAADVTVPDAGLATVTLTFNTPPAF